MNMIFLLLLAMGSISCTRTASEVLGSQIQEVQGPLNKKYGFQITGYGMTWPVEFEEASYDLDSM